MLYLWILAGLNKRGTNWDLLMSSGYNTVTDYWWIMANVDIKTPLLPHVDWCDRTLLLKGPPPSVWTDPISFTIKLLPSKCGLSQSQTTNNRVLFGVDWPNPTTPPSHLPPGVDWHNLILPLTSYLPGMGWHDRTLPLTDSDSQSSVWTDTISHYHFHTHTYPGCGLTHSHIIINLLTSGCGHNLTLPVTAPVWTNTILYHH